MIKISFYLTDIEYGEIAEKFLPMVIVFFPEPVRLILPGHPGFQTLLPQGNCRTILPPHGIFFQVFSDLSAFLRHGGIFLRIFLYHDLIISL